MHTASLAPSFPTTRGSSCPLPAGAALPHADPAAWLALGEQLLPYLQEVPDPRAARGRRYPLPLLLVLCLLGLCCGSLGYLSIARWARKLKPDLRRELGFTHGRTPCAGTLLNLFRKLDWDCFAQQLHRWAEAACLPSPAVPADTPAEAGEGPPDPPWQGVALDGKALRGSLAAGADVAHVVSLVAHRLGVSLADVGVAAKQGELTVAPEVLAPVLGPGRVITGDALFTQRGLCRQIRDGGSHYVLPVKGNQPTLLREVQAVLGSLAPRDVREQERAGTWTVDVGHGRIENRYLLLATPAPGAVSWPGVAQVFFLERCRYRQRGKGRPAVESREVVYGITSLGRPEAGPETVLRLQRGHWSIENQVHWVLDTFFREDARRILEGQIARGMAALRRGALNLLRLLGARSVPEASDWAKADPSALLAIIGVPTEN